ncbi:MAG: RNA-binding protein [Alphaproteobacteria bacterium]|nr:RNA-binding protein [Alphaproteobacteria bacterium]
MRTCIATGVGGAAENFIRFVLSPEGVVAPDFSEKLPGRGAWVTATREALKIAVKKGAFERAFKQSAGMPPDLPGMVDAGLTKRALSALGMARKTGDVVLGFDQVKSALKEKRIAVLIAASDGAQDGRRKLKMLSGEAPVIEVFSGSEISAALGRVAVVHVGLKSSAGSARFLRAARRLEGFRAQDAL